MYCRYSFCLPVNYVEHDYADHGGKAKEKTYSTDYYFIVQSNLRNMYDLDHPGQIHVAMLDIFLASFVMRQNATSSPAMGIR